MRPIASMAARAAATRAASSGDNGAPEAFAAYRLMRSTFTFATPPPYVEAPTTKENAMNSSKWSKRFWADLAERVGSVLVYSLITYLTLDNALENVDFQRLWLVIVLPTVLSLLKGLAANMKDPESGASLLNAPPSGDGPIVNDDPIH